MSGLKSARALLNYRQARFTQRLYVRPRGGGRSQEFLTGERSVFTTRLQASAAFHRGETADALEWGTGCHFSGRLIAEVRAGALQAPSKWRRRDTIWTEVSHIDSGEVEAACIWQSPGDWTERHFHIETKKAVFDAVIFAIYQALRALDQRQASVPRYTVFVDSTTTIDRDPEPGQRFAIVMMDFATGSTPETTK